MALFLPIRAVVGNTYFSVLAYALAQIGVTVLLVLLLSRLFPTDSKTSAEQRQIIDRRNGIALFSLLLTIAFLMTRGKSDLMAGIGIPHGPYFRILHSVFHFGNIINTLIAVLVIVPLLKDEAKSGIWNYLALFTTSILATISDALFIVSFAVPSIISTITSSIFYASKKVILIKINSILLLGVASAFLLKLTLLSDNLNSSYLFLQTDFLEQTKSLFEILFLSTKYMPLPMLYISIFYGIILWKLSRELEKENKNMAHLYLYVFIILSVVLTFLALIINGVLGNSAYPANRYFLNFYWLPVLFSWLFADIFCSFNQLHFVRTQNIAFCTLLTILMYASLPNGKLYRSYYPTMVQCVDEALQKYEDATGVQLKNGLSSYGPTKIITEFSRRDLELFQVQPNFSPFLWVANTTNYPSHYDFAVILYPQNREVPDSQVLSRINGSPEYEKICQNTQTPVKILIYGENKISLP
ncbi:MAG: hypothetical protein AAFY41_04340 [Bacteroidota bacterium]